MPEGISHLFPFFLLAVTIISTVYAPLELLFGAKGRKQTDFFLHFPRNSNPMDGKREINANAVEI